MVIWRKLDRVLPEKRPDGGWARRRLDAMAAKTAEHLGIVFHRYLEGAEGREPRDHGERAEGGTVEPVRTQRADHE